jgi:hypothetical protein
MLAPFFMNILTWCGVLLLTGWAWEVVNGWRRHAVSNSNRSVPGRASQFKPHVPVRVDCDSLLTSGMTKHTKNA